MSDYKEKAREILGVDLNQSLHHLIGYWYATKTSATFDTALACAMVEVLLKEIPNPVSAEVIQLQAENAELKETILRKDNALENEARMRQYYVDKTIRLQAENAELRELCRLMSNELIYLSPVIAEKYADRVDKALEEGER